MSHPRVVNVRDKGAIYQVYVGRGLCPRTGQPGKLGNPYSIKVHGPDAMRLYLDYVAELGERFREHVVRHLAGKVLGCWCAPGPCHGEVLARLADGEPLGAIREGMLRDCGLAPNRDR